MTTTTRRPNLRVVPNAVTTSKPSPRRKAPKDDPQPRAYSPDGEIGRRVAEAFAIKHEIDRLKALLEPKKAFLKAHCEKHNLSRIDVGPMQVQYKSRSNWTYSPALKNEMLRIQNLQEQEKMDKIAKNKPTMFVSLDLSAKAAQEA